MVVGQRALAFGFFIFFSWGSIIFVFFWTIVYAKKVVNILLIVDQHIKHNTRSRGLWPWFFSLVVGFILYFLLDNCICGICQTFSEL